MNANLEEELYVNSVSWSVKRVRQRRAVRFGSALRTQHGCRKRISYFANS